MTEPARRWSGEWASSAPPPPPAVEVLIPTRDRPAEPAVTLAGLAAQDDPAFDVIVSDQSENGGVLDAPAVRAMRRVLEAQGHGVTLARHLPPRGLAEQRQFLLDQATAASVLFLDDDVWLEPGALARMIRALDELACGFVGMFPQALSYLGDDRPQQRTSFDPWPGAVRPERVRHGDAAIDRLSLHAAANLTHLARDLGIERDGWVPYRIAWLGACVLYRRDALVEAGGFDFWERLPDSHVGEDVTAEWRVMERFGAAGLVPSGSVHLEAPTTVPDRRVDAPAVVFSAAGRSD